MDSPTRPLDFTLVLHGSRLPDVDALKRGALSARNRFPATGCRVEGRQWVRMDPTRAGLAIQDAGNGAVTAEIRNFIRPPMHLDREPPVRQLLIREIDGGGAVLATRMHHAGADLVGTLMWLGHQLGVAAGQEPFVDAMARFEPVALRRALARTRKNPSAYRGGCDPLWTRPGMPSALREWKTRRIPSAKFRDLSRSGNGFSYNDLLLTCALETLDWWNQEHGVARKRLGVWVPINIRQEAFTGFGNGTSRIRIYRRYPDDAPLRVKCQEVGRQLKASRENGEWRVPDGHFLRSLPASVSASLLRAYVNRPWVDMGTSALSHVERWPAGLDARLEHLVGIDIIEPLHMRHPLMMAALTHRDATWMSWTYDPALLAEEDVEPMGQFFEKTLDDAQF